MFKFAFVAVGEHVPPEQLMFCVAAEEMVNAACDAVAKSIAAANGTA